MLIRFIAMLGLAAALGGCATAPASPTAHLAAPAHASWNDGVWNSVLGYHGPANATVMGGPSGGAAGAAR